MEEREKLVVLGHKLIQAGLVKGAGGNISIRKGNSMYVTPSGLGLGECREEDLVDIDISTGEYSHDTNVPTCEYLIHLNIYRKRQDVNVVVHAHPPHVIGICSAGAEIRPMTPDAAAYLYPIRQIPFITPGGQELADAVAGSVEDGTNTVVMENHGTVTLGRSCREAFMRTELLEEEAKIQSIACAAGNPHFLTDSQVQDIRNLNVEKYRQEKAAETDSI